MFRIKHTIQTIFKTPRRTKAELFCFQSIENNHASSFKVVGFTQSIICAIRHICVLPKVSTVRQCVKHTQKVGLLFNSLYGLTATISVYCVNVCSGKLHKYSEQGINITEIFMKFLKNLIYVSKNSNSSTTKDLDMPVSFKQFNKTIVH